MCIFVIIKRNFTKFLVDLKYRRLTLAELSALEAEFVRFLGAKSILAEDWEKFKEKETEKVDALINEFSKVVYQKTIFNIEYLLKAGIAYFVVYHITQDQIISLTLNLEKKSGINLLDFEDIKTLTSKLEKLKEAFKVVKIVRPFKEDRHNDVFELLESGATILKDSDLFEWIEQNLSV